MIGHLGVVKLPQGLVFDEAGISHVMMRKRLRPQAPP